MITGSATYYNNLGDTPSLIVLSFTPPTTAGLEWIEIYEAGSPNDVFVERERVVDRIPGIYPYWYMLLCSTPGTSYVVDYLTSTGAPILGQGNRLVTEAYTPPVPIMREIFINGPLTVKELVRRQYLVLETMGERAILLRRRHEGTVCSCRLDTDRQPRSRCRECFGTGWAGGYDVFYPFLFNFQLAGPRLQLTETAIALDQAPRAWTTIVPELRNGDVVVRSNKELLDRYEVTNPQRAVKDGVAGVPTIQEFTVKAHDQGHPVYSFPVERFVASYERPTSQSGLSESGV